MASVCEKLYNYCLACSCCTKPCHSHSHLIRTSILRLAPTLPNPHYPSKSTTTLASLVKGRWIDGKTQTVVLLLSACDMPTLFIMQTFLPSRRRDCFTPPTLPETHYPLKCYTKIGHMGVEKQKGKVYNPPWLFPTHQPKTTSFFQPCNHLHPFAIDFL